VPELFGGRMKKIRLAVLMGGMSSERDISLISGREVVKNLNKKKYEVLVYDPAADLIKLAQDKDKIDLVFPVLHGRYGEDGTIQGFLELLGLPYVGSGILASALAMDKNISQKMYQNAGILVPKTIVSAKSNWSRNTHQLLQDIKMHLGIPCVVKPNNQGSSIGITIVKKEKELKKALEKVFSLSSEVLIQEFIEGKEVTGPVLGNQNPIALPVIEIVPPKGRFFDRETKYNGSTREIVPARISKELTKVVQDLAVKAHQVLGCRVFSRTDMIIKEAGANKRLKAKDQQPEIYVLETNTIPGMTSESLFPKAAQAAGISFSELLDKLIDLALEREL